jgi:hypothetical protein
MQSLILFNDRCKAIYWFIINMIMMYNVSNMNIK